MLISLGQEVTQFVPVGFPGVTHWYRLVGLTPFATYKAIWSFSNLSEASNGTWQVLKECSEIIYPGLVANGCQDFEIGDTDTIEISFGGLAIFEGFQYTFTILEGEC